MSNLNLFRFMYHIC